jgi:hypothetical protein
MEAKKMGLKVNINKTKYMQVGSKLPKRKGLEVGYYDWEAID